MPEGYEFKDLLFFTKKKAITVKDKSGNKVGTIIRTFDERGFTDSEQVRKGTFYAFKDGTGKLTASFAVKKKGWKAVLGYAYELYFAPEEKVFHLADVKALIYLYFHVKGQIAGDMFEVHEDWDENIVLKVNKRKYAVIVFDEKTFQVTIDMIDGSVDARYKNPAFLSLIYCIYRMYDIERTIIDEIIDEFT